jgi:hypothetical protein
MVWRISEGRVVRWSVGGEEGCEFVSEVLAMLGQFGCNSFCVGSMGNSMAAGVTSVFIAALFEARGHTDRSAQANFTSNRSFWDFRTESYPAMGIVIIKSSIVFLSGSLVAILVDVERPHLSSLF